MRTEMGQPERQSVTYQRMLAMPETYEFTRKKIAAARSRRFREITLLLAVFCGFLAFFIWRGDPVAGVIFSVVMASFVSMLQGGYRP